MKVGTPLQFHRPKFAIGLAQAPPGCVLYLPGIRGGGAKIFDRSAFGNHGAITGPTWKRGPSGIWVLDYAAGTDHVNYGNPASLNLTKAITIEGWIKPGSIAAGLQAFVSKLQSGCPAYRCYQNQQSIGLHINAASVYSGNVLSVGKWTFLTFTYDKSLTTGNLKCFICGVLIAQADLQEDIITNTKDLVTGIDADTLTSYPLTAQLAEVKLYNRALNINEITRQHQILKQWFK